jgi:hypothetical protein
MLMLAHVPGLALPPVIRLVVEVGAVLVRAVLADAVDCHNLISPASLISLRLAFFSPLYYFYLHALIL